MWAQSWTIHNACYRHTLKLLNQVIRSNIINKVGNMNETYCEIMCVCVCVCTHIQTLGISATCVYMFRKSHLIFSSHFSIAFLSPRSFAIVRRQCRSRISFLTMLNKLRDKMQLAISRKAELYWLIVSLTKANNKNGSLCFANTLDLSKYYLL